MNTPSPMTVHPASTLAVGQNRVLRNTYWLLALSMVPTVLGAWIGVATGFNLFKLAHPAIGFIVFLAAAFGFIFAIQKTKNSAAGVPVLLAFTFFMGLMLAGMLSMVLSFKNGASLIALAFGGTAAIFTGMAAWASTIKRDLSGMGKALFIGVIMLLVAGFANIFLQLPGLMIALSVIALGIFSAFLLYDLNRIMMGGEDNYISATLSVYLDLFNIFQNLLALLGIFGGERD